ncbi:MAG: hypothetical protein JKY11_05615 [Alphaproteobacteria bacterium]|nr:hypothetical protein [Alphaproteobacteria bacterium]
MLKKLSILFVITIVACLVARTSFSQDASQQHTLSDQVTIETANAYLEKCMGTFPKNFTPEAQKVFCNCSAANIRLNMTNTDLVDLNKKASLKAGNEVYEKYIQKVIAPCMSAATDHIAYVSCLENRGHSPYIKNILPYCQCTGYEMRKWVAQKGASAIIINMTNNPRFYTDPIQTLLTVNQYNAATAQAYSTCRPLGVERKKNRL